MESDVKSDIRDIIDELEKNRILSEKQFLFLLESNSDTVRQYISEKARNISYKYFENKIYIRGLIEFTNYCKNNCYYCGIRAGNQSVPRYRLSKEDILSCCEQGYDLGFHTFVLQGGEDPYYTDDVFEDIILSIKNKYPDCAITLSIGERTKEAYHRFKNAGADRFLLRHETANSEHYSKLHPSNLTLENRKKCLFYLKECGFQVGTGFMVGSPYQENKNIVEDLLFIKELSPHMIGIGPFLPHHETPFKDEPKGSFTKTLLVLSILRLMNPNALIPSTTALGTINQDGREAGIFAGCNVVMPNLSPKVNRKNYSLYDNKIATGDEAAESVLNLEKRINSIGYIISRERGDFVPECSI